jgi:hypothetical protein
MILRTVRKLATFVSTFAVAGMITAVVQPASATPTLPMCAALATDPANGIIGNPAIKSATSAVVPATGGDVAYCQVNLLYGTNPNQNINIVVGLPLSLADGGSGGLQGAWNGRTQGLGGAPYVAVGGAGLFSIENRAGWEPSLFKALARDQSAPLEAA